MEIPLRIMRLHIDCRMASEDEQDQLEVLNLAILASSVEDAVTAHDHFPLDFPFYKFVLCG